MFYKKNSRVPFEGSKMHIDEWCEKYGINFNLFQKRISDGWTASNALIIPNEIGMVMPHNVKRVLTLIGYGWRDDELLREFIITQSEIDGIRSLSEEKKKVFMSSDVFWVEPTKENMAILLKGDEAA